MIFWVVPSYPLVSPVAKVRVAVDIEEMILVSYFPTLLLSPDVPMRLIIRTSLPAARQPEDGVVDKTIEVASAEVLAVDE